MSMMSYVALGEAEWVLEREGDEDIVLKPGATATCVMGNITAISLRFNPGLIVCTGNDITMPYLEDLGELQL
jgi:hypothetical protein